MKKLKIFSLALPALLAAASFVQASSLGLDDDPLGSRVGGAVGWAIFDTFSDSDPNRLTLSFSNLAPNSSNGSGVIANPTISAVQGGSVTGGGERVYNGTDATSAAFNVQIKADVLSDINAVTVQVKYTLGDSAVMNLSNYKDFFTLSLNGISGTPVEFVSPTLGNGLEVVGSAPNAQPFGVVKWTWTNLGLQSGDQINVAISSPAHGHVSVDSFAIDATPVPEPHEYALGTALLLGVVVLMRRRRLATAG